MKKSLFLLAVLFPMHFMAQNVQFLYDFGKDRNYATTTLEMFKPDKWGDSFYFADFYYDFGPQNHTSGAYFEIARNLRFWDAPLSAHLEFNGGIGTFPLPVGRGVFPINNAFLIGVDYGLHNDDFTRTLNFTASYKHILGKQNSAQLTAVWGLHFFNRKVSFTGFADFWLENNAAQTTSTVFLTQPQLWYNFTDKLSAGAEIELANNFAETEGFMVRPKIAAKWNF